jgi:phthiocerol/phenolphthiocerol synthesis type-I polyketide synthase E
MNSSGLKGVAIVGMAGRFPGASNVDEFWRNLVEGVESITRFTDEELAAAGFDVEALRKDPNFVPCRGILPGVENFDAGFFSMTANEASVTDPQQRIFLETAWEAMESAGYDPEKYEGLVGVYGGLGGMSYYLNHLHGRADVMDMVGERMLSFGNDKDFLATRVAYKLNLKGPALNINTACSTSLVTVCQACQELLTHQCDLALAGGVSLTFPQKGGVRYQEGGIFAPDGHCRPFDAKAQGTVSSDGVGVVLLKRLSEAVADGDQIFAVIKGFGRNNDGSVKVGFSAPSVDGQAEAIATAQATAHIDPDTISYVEGHGTGTPLGDPIEIAALTQAFRLGTDARHFCALGSVKGNFGHLNSAAGVAGLIKTALALKNEKIPASLNFSEPNPKIDFEDSPFYVNTKLKDWKRSATPRRAGVSSFGLGGTNAHVVLEEAPTTEASGPSRPAQLLVFSARSAKALDDATANFVSYLKAHPEIDLPDAAYTLKVGRRAFPCRRVVACRDVADAVEALETCAPKRVITRKADAREPQIVFMFPGQGTQYVNMGAELYRTEPVFRDEMDRCAELFLPHLGADLRLFIYPEAEEQQIAGVRLAETRFTQPAMFMIEYALAKLWISWGITPNAMIGHSLGEYVAACIAGVFTLEEAVQVVAGRALLIHGLPGGLMMAVRLPEKELLPILPRELSIAGINSPALCTVAGPEGAIKAFEAELKEKSIAGRLLETSHAFHSNMMDPAMEPLMGLLEKVSLKAPAIPYISDVTGTWITADEARLPAYWASHLRQPVRLADGVGELLKNPDVILLEVGPGLGLSMMANQHPDRNVNRPALASFHAAKGGELTSMLTALGALWASGKVVDWSLLHERERRHRIPLPTYPFQRERYWIEPLPKSRVAVAATDGAQPQHVSVMVAEAGRGDASSARNGSVASEEQMQAARHARPDIGTVFAEPATKAERAIAVVWRQVFGLQEVGIHDDFYALGGDSLLAVQLIDRMKKTLGFSPSIPVFAQNSTVGKLGAVADQQGLDLGEPEPAQKEVPVETRESASELLTFRANGSRPPLFYLHGDFSGGGLYSGQISKRLSDDQPFHILPPYRSGKERLITVEEMVEHHLPIILAHTPHGPYLLGGYCIGAIVAVEIARRLVKEGHEVQHLILIDFPQRRSAVVCQGWHFVNKLGDGLKWDMPKKMAYFDRYIGSFVRWSRLTTNEKLGAFGRRFGLVKADRRVGGGTPDLTRDLDFGAYFLAASFYTPKQISIPATLYFAEETFPVSYRIKHSSQDFVSPNVEMLTGNHYTCITTNVNLTGDRIEKTLAMLYPPKPTASHLPTVAASPVTQSGELTKVL